LTWWCWLPRPSSDLSSSDRCRVSGQKRLQKCVDTEIDWVAYMQQIETYLSGDKNYGNYMVYESFLISLGSNWALRVPRWVYLLILLALLPDRQRKEHLRKLLSLKPTPCRKPSLSSICCTSSRSSSSSRSIAWPSIGITQTRPRYPHSNAFSLSS
jgi:hypothetical protein